MPRKPNYRFERQERDRRKAAKKEEKLKARQSRKDGGTAESAAVADSEPSAKTDATQEDATQE